MKTDRTKKESDCRTVYVRQDNSSTVTCPHCQNRYGVNAIDVKVHGRRCKVTCRCGHSFTVFFEFRENPRRQLSVEGYYRTIKEFHMRGICRTDPGSENFHRMLVKNISLTGIGFVVPTGHEIQVGDRVEVMFTLDDMESIRIERTAIVRRLADGNYVGCEFTDIGHLDKDTGFYVMT